MALTRKLLKGMGLTDEQVDTIIEAHGDTVDGLKNDIQRYKADAEKLPGVQKELDDLKKDNGDDFKARYEKERQDFQAYKDGIAKKEAAAAKEKAARAYFESKGIPAKSMGLVIRGAKGEIESLELDGEKIKDTKSLDALVDGTYKGLVSTTQTKGANPASPPANTGGSGVTAEAFKKMGYADRLKLKKESPEQYSELTKN